MRFVDSWKRQYSSILHILLILFRILFSLLFAFKQFSEYNHEYYIEAHTTYETGRYFPYCIIFNKTEFQNERPPHVEWLTTDIENMITGRGWSV